MDSYLKIKSYKMILNEYKESRRLSTPVLRNSIFLQVKAGFGMNIIGIIIVTLSINTYGMTYFGLDKFPGWAFGASSKGNCPAASTSMTTTLALNVTTFAVNATAAAVGIPSTNLSTTATP